MHTRATKHFQYGLLRLTPKERKEIKLFTRESSQQVKEQREIFLGFLLITTTSMEIKLTNFLFFYFFLRFIEHTRRKLEKEIKLPWIVR